MEALWPQNVTPLVYNCYIHLIQIFRQYFLDSVTEIHTHTYWESGKIESNGGEDDEDDGDLLVLTLVMS